MKLRYRIFLVTLLCLLAIACLFFYASEKAAASPLYPEKACLKMASWNIRILSKKRNAAALARIAAILRDYDFISILEVRDQEVIAQLCLLLAQYGKQYSYELSPPLGRKIKERYCFLYNRQRIRVLIPGQVFPDPEDKFIREPYYATFVCDQFDFTFISTHVIWGKTVGERRREITELARVFRYIQDQDPYENDVILAGDFNRSPKDDLAFAALKSIPNMIYLFAEPERTMIGDTNLYDNIWFQKNFVREFMNHKGMVRFDEVDFAGDRRLASKVVSDHRPIWALFKVTGPDDD